MTKTICNSYGTCSKPVVSCSRCEHRDLSDLDERFKEFHRTGERVEVEWKEGFGDYSGYGCRTEGKKARFYVGVSTGRKPIYLQIYRSDSTGGQAILSCAVKSIRGLNKFQPIRIR